MSVLSLINTHVLALLIASGLDFVIGDPWTWPHPVKVMGWAIARSSKFILAKVTSRAMQRWAGAILAVGLVGISGAMGWLVVTVSYNLSLTLGLVAESILLASCFAGRSLRDAAVAVLTALESRDLVKTRTVLSLYVGRDTENLEPPEILRAVLETVAENCTDGVIAPLFYALIGGVPLALAYKALSTLDSMIGYKQTPYTYIGWASAKLEDLCSWLPCRYTVLSIAMLSGNPRKVWNLCCRDAPQDPSPNSGWSECAFAAALGVQLGGANTYRGVTKFKPLLAEPERLISPTVVRQALTLMRLSFLSLLVIGCLGLQLVRR